MSIYKLRTDMGHYFKWLLLLVLVPIFVISGAMYFGSSPGGGPGGRTEYGSAVIAKVNDVEIARGEFESAWSLAADEARSRGMRSPLQCADLRAGLLQRMIGEISLLQMAEKMGVDVSEERVDAQVDKYVTSYLQQNREAVLGKLTAEAAKTDPREDENYKKELAGIGSSLSQQEEFAKQRIPRNQIVAQLAEEGINEKIKRGIKPVTDAEIDASYNVYKLRQIILPTGSLPGEQLMSAANKIVAEARGGADFAKLARDNMKGAGKDAGAARDVESLALSTYPKQARESIEKLKSGEVTQPIETPFGVLVAKMEGVTSKLPANLDKKARDARRKEIMQMREAIASMELRQDLTKNQSVVVKDKELQGYWYLIQAQRATSQAEQKKLIESAIASLAKARAERPDSPWAPSKLAQLLFQTGKTEKAIGVLYPMIAGPKATQEGADMRLLLGDMLIKKGETVKAMEQYKIAGEVARSDEGIHQQLLVKYQQLKRPDLVAGENKWMADYKERVKQLEATGRRSMPSPPGAPAPSGPKE